MSRDPRVEIWNVLHDGEITAIAGEGSDTLTMFVSIPYLRRRLPPLGDSFVLTLTGVRRAAFQDSDGATTSLGEELDIGTPEILSTESEAMPVTIETTLGKLVLDFDDVRFAMDTGQPVDFEVIEKTSEEYWDEWSAKTRKA
jgi:hypothetical protein